MPGRLTEEDIQLMLQVLRCEGIWRIFDKLRLAEKLDAIIDEWEDPTPLAQAETKLKRIRQVCEDTPREPGDIESADIPSAFLDVLTRALDEIQEEAAP